ncbi:thioredoxin family protein [Pseudomonas syringae]|nr:thioredoxin family protein [Pseudomonas syringae]
MVPYKELFATGQRFDDFVTTGLQSEQTAAQHFADKVRLPGALSTATQQRLVAIRGAYHLLIAGEIWCPDCQINVAAFDYLCEVQPAIDLAVVSRGRAQNNLKTELGLEAIAIPLVLVLDEQFSLIGQFVERPQVVVTDGGEQALHEYKMGNHMQDSITQVLALIEAWEKRMA